MSMHLNKGQVKTKKIMSFANPVTTHSKNSRFSLCYQDIKGKRLRNDKLI